MRRASSITALAVGIMLAVGSAAYAQGPTPTDRDVFGNIDIGGLTQTHSFSTSYAKTIFNEQATVDLNETVGSGFMWGIRAGYRWRPAFAFALGIWGTKSNSESSIVASIPDPVVNGKFKTVTVNGSGMHQTDIGLDFQLVWMIPVSSRILLTVSGGPTVLHVSQDVATVTVANGTQNVSPSSENESKTTGKAGNVGVDALYSLGSRYGLGAFVRYAGGTVDLPSVSGLSVGGVQVGGRLQMWF